MSSPGPAPPAPGLLPRLARLPSRLAGVVIGLFVLWQLVFLCGYNALEMLEEARTHVPPEAQEIVDTVAPGWRQGEGPLYEATKRATKVGSAWAQLTSQSQGWSLFAPNVFGDIPFPAVELRWDEPAGVNAVPLPPLPGADVLDRLGLGHLGNEPKMPTVPEWVLSDNEPRDPDYFFRWGHFRLRRFEGNLGVVMVEYRNETAEQARARWKKDIEKELREDWDATLAYLKWRLAAWRREHPGRSEPFQVVLHVRRYHIVAPGEERPWTWTGPFTEPLARWLPGVPTPAGRLPVQMFDPVRREYVWLEQR